MSYADVLLVSKKIMYLVDRYQFQFTLKARAYVLTLFGDARLSCDLTQHIVAEASGLGERLVQALFAHRFQYIADRVRIKCVNRVLVIRCREYHGWWSIKAVQVMRSF